MDTINNSGIGRNIVPRARRGIHSHRVSPVADSYTMVRYGVDDGVDEVDNVLSKPSQPISPTLFPANQKRRSSLNDDNKSYTEDETNMLSKSVPASLPSHALSSDSSDDEETPNRQNLSNETRQRNNGSPGLTRSQSVSNASFAHLNESTEYPQTKNTYPQLIIVFILSLIVGIVAIKSPYFAIFHTNKTENIIYDEYKFHRDINNLGRKYNIGENALIQVQSGISTIYQRKDTGSFMFVYNTNVNNFDTNKFNQFINDVSLTASQYLRNDSAPVQYTIVEGYDLDMKDHGELIDKFREDLENSGVMLVKHIEAIPSELAMAFHYYCDEYNPLVTKSAIFFTLNMAKCSTGDDDKSIHATIEKCLTNKWNSVNEDSIRPLLTRVVSIVIDVTQVFIGK